MSISTHKVDKTTVGRPAAAKPMAAKPTVRFISLGCPKNLVDSEVMTGHLVEDHFRLVAPDESSDIGVINTCGFIDASKKESINTILELAEEKKAGKLKVLVVAGCLSQRYKEELPKLIPEVDMFIGTADFTRLPQLVRDKISGETQREYILDPSELMDAHSPRHINTPKHFRYVKVSEGCSHQCTFCTIPSMRGGLKSRTTSDVLEELRSGLADGVKEFNLIAQDLNEFGRDLPERESLHQLFEEMGKLGNDFWVRPLYMYPLQFPDKLIRLLKNHPNIIPYVDIPLQHIDDKILKLMKRGSSSKYIYRLIEQLRKNIPGIVIRTTFIVGFPGETQKEFKHLKKFIKEAEFDNLGVFTYSQEEGTPSALLPGQVAAKVKKQRRDELMKLQREIVKRKSSGHVGKKYKVLCEGQALEMSPNGDIVPKVDERVLKKVKNIPLLGRGRFYGQAPDIDGQVVIVDADRNSPFLRPGQFIDCEIIDYKDYDLIAKPSLRA